MAISNERWPDYATPGARAQAGCRRSTSGCHDLGRWHGHPTNSKNVKRTRRVRDSVNAERQTQTIGFKPCSFRNGRQGLTNGGHADFGSVILRQMHAVRPDSISEDRPPFNSIRLPSHALALAVTENLPGPVRQRVSFETRIIGRHDIVHCAAAGNRRSCSDTKPLPNTRPQRSSHQDNQQRNQSAFWLKELSWSRCRCRWLNGNFLSCQNRCQSPKRTKTGKQNGNTVGSCHWPIAEMP